MTADLARPQPLIRLARPDDVADILAMIHELADYERALDEVRATPDLLHSALFAPEASAHCHIACHVGEDGDRVVGFALWFLNFSTWQGRPGIFLEDLYVRPEARGRGVGTALLRELARICIDRGYPRLDWQVLDWNEPSRRFYDSLGALSLTEWVPCRLTGTPLQQLAAS